MVVYIKAALDLLLKALDWFPGWKTKVGAAITVIGTLMTVYNSYIAAMVGFEIPPEIVVAVQTAGSTLVAVGVAAPATRA